MTGPLAGVRVVVLAGMGPVPFTGMLLADMGAQVVRVTRPPSRLARSLSQVDGLSEEHDVVNRGVDTVAIDLKDPGGVDLALRLAAAADVFIEGYRPGVAERLGLGPDVVLQRNPAVVYARLTGYGQSGPLAREAGHDINYVAQSGALNAMARPGEAPRPPVNLLGDYAGGGMTAAFGIACALLEARASGRGQVIDAAMVDGVALLTAKLQGLRAAGLFSDQPGTNWIDSGAPFYDTYRCADGRYIAVGALEPDFYREFTARLGVDVTGWPDQDDRTAWPRLRELIASAIADRSQAEWAAIFAAPTRASRPSSPSRRRPGTRTTPSAASSTASTASCTRPPHPGSAGPRPGARPRPPPGLLTCTGSSSPGARRTGTPRRSQHIPDGPGQAARQGALNVCERT